MNLTSFVLGFKNCLHIIGIILTFSYIQQLIRKVIVWDDLLGKKRQFLMSQLYEINILLSNTILHKFVSIFYYKHVVSLLFVFYYRHGGLAIPQNSKNGCQRQINLIVIVLGWCYLIVSLMGNIHIRAQLTKSMRVLN